MEAFDYLNVNINILTRIKAILKFLLKTYFSAQIIPLSQLNSLINLVYHTAKQFINFCTFIFIFSERILTEIKTRFY
jgi:hypothetical protein